MLHRAPSIERASDAVIRQLALERMGRSAPKLAPFGSMGGVGFWRPAGNGVPVDGPDGWYRPETGAHFTTLGMNTPDHLLLCQDTGSPLVPTIDTLGAGNWTAGAGGALYEQTVTGWTAKAMGFDGTAVNQRFTNTSSAFELAAGDSFASIMFMSFTAPAASAYTQLFQGAANSVQLLASGLLRSRHNSVISDSTNSHAGLSTVRMIGWYRNAATNASGVVTNLESFTNTHDETAQTGVVHCIGPSTTSAQQHEGRYLWVAYWKGTNAEFNMSSYITTLMN